MTSSKHLLLLFLLHLAFLPAVGQDYGLIKPYQENYYRDQGGNITAIGVDSADYDRGNVVYTLTSSSQTGGPQVKTYPSKKVQESFLGNQLSVLKNGTTVLSSFYSETAYTICHQCHKGQTWKVSDTYSGMVKDVVLDTVEGLLDSIKIIEFIPGRYQVHLSKKHGLVKSPELFSPWSTWTSFQTMERTEKISLSKKDVYDMSVDDEFHWRVYSGSKWKYDMHVLKIRSKKLLNDSVQYTIKRNIETSEGDLHSDQVTRTYPYTEEPIFNSLPGELFPLDTSGDSTALFSYVFRTGESWEFGDIYWNREYIYFSYIEGEKHGKTYFVKGCGEFFNIISEKDAAYPKKRELVYYKKGNEVWGYAFPTSSPRIHPEEVHRPLIYPSLANQTIYIANQNEYGMATLQSLNGRVEHIDLSNGRYNTNHLPSGVYFITFKSGRREKFLVVR